MIFIIAVVIVSLIVVVLFIGRGDNEEKYHSDEMKDE